MALSCKTYRPALLATAALFGVTALVAPCRQARADEVSPTGKGIVGGGLLGAEAVTIDVEALPAVTAAEEAAKDGAPQLYDDVPNNVSLDYHFGDAEATKAAFAAAAATAAASAALAAASADALGRPGLRALGGGLCLRFSRQRRGVEVRRG